MKALRTVRTRPARIGGRLTALAVLTTLMTVPAGGAHAAPAPAAPEVAADQTAPGPPTDVRWGVGPVHVLPSGEHRWTDSTVRWTAPADDGTPIVRVHWKLCRRWGGAIWPEFPAGVPAQCLTGSAGPEPFPLDESPIPVGAPPRACIGYVTTLMIWLEDAAGNVDLDPRNAGGTGFGATPLCGPPPPPPLPDPPVDLPEPPAAARAATALAVTTRVRAVRNGQRRRQRLTVAARTTARAASGKVRIRVTGRQGKRKLTRARTVTLAKGRARYTLTVPKGIRRLSVRADYAGSKTHAPSSRTTTVRIPRR
ncbi:MAG: hypothetical protein ITG02_15545 [Patulibacter sp.]|nr:hypothetical protein [Patulibacter sp.]